MNATDVVGYAYDADAHCMECTCTRFNASNEWLSTHEVIDAEGNPIHPIFADQADEIDACGDCSRSLLTGERPDWWDPNDDKHFSDLDTGSIAPPTSAEISAAVDVLYRAGMDVDFIPIRHTPMRHHTNEEDNQSSPSSFVLLHYEDDWERVTESILFASEDAAMQHVIAHATRRYVDGTGNVSHYAQFNNGADSYHITHISLSAPPARYDGPWIEALPYRADGYGGGPSLAWEVKTEEDAEHIRTINSTRRERA